MADPVTAALAIGGMAATAVGGMMSAGGTMYAGEADRTKNLYQQRIADMNSTLAKQDAEYAIEAGTSEQVIAGLKGRQIVGSIKAGIGAANLDPTKGSAVGVIKSQEAANVANQKMILANATKRAYGFEVAAAEDTAQGNLYALSADTSMTAAKIGATASLLGAGGQGASMGMTASQKGVFSGGSVAPQWYGSNDPNLGIGA